MNIYTLPDEVEKALDTYYACFDSLTAELIATDEELAKAEATLADLQNRSDEVLQWYLEDRANNIAKTEMMKSEIERISKHMQGYEKRVEKSEMLITRLFDRVYEGKPISVGTFSVGFRKSKAVVIDDETMIPEEFMNTPEPTAPKPDKKAIKEAIESGADVMGARIEERKNLSIK